MEKFVLCRPGGGLNDMLNQIERCCRYAEGHGRLVVVDTAYRHALHFKDSFAKYFISREKPLLLQNPLPDAVLDSLDVFPAALKGRLSSYRTLERAGAWVDSASGTPLTFDMERAYAETVLIHHQGGGGGLSGFLLARLRMQPRLLGLLEGRIRELDRPFAATHIRNTDMTTDYHAAIDRLRERRLPLLFVASDNAQVVRDFVAGLPETRVVSFSSLPDNGGLALHIGMPREAAEQRNTDAILDVLTLALAKPLLRVRTQNAVNANYSGYTRLAALLNENPRVLHGLFSGSAFLQGYVSEVLG